MPESLTRPVRPPSRIKAFSLVEVVLAVAVTTIALVSIVSLFPVGLNSAASGRNQTRAAYLAKQLVSDLRSSPFTNAAVLFRNTNNGTLEVLTSFNLTTGATNFLACDQQNDVVALASPVQYASGMNDPGVNCLVQVSIVPTAWTNLCQVSLEVSAPAQAPLAARTRYGFQTMIGDKQ